MKNFILGILILSVSVLLYGCGDKNEKIKVIATRVPHGEILNETKSQLKDRGYKLEVTIIDDYYIPNDAVKNKEADANFFQHIPFLEKYNSTNKDEKLVIASEVHIEPIGVYSNIHSKNDFTLEKIEDGSTALISNSQSDHYRVLRLFESAGLIKLKDDVNLNNFSNIKDSIQENEKNIVFKTDIAPNLIYTAYAQKENYDFFVINSNYVLAAGKKPLELNIFLENAVDNPYVNVLATRESHLSSDKIKALVEVLKSDEIKKFINDKYQGSVIAA